MDQNAIKLIEDLSDTNIGLGDFIRLKGLKIGYIIHLKHDNGEGEDVERKVLIIGNATPYEGVSRISHDGWDWKSYNFWQVEKVYQIGDINTVFLDSHDMGNVFSSRKSCDYSSYCCSGLDIEGCRRKGEADCCQLDRHDGWSSDTV